MTKEVPKKILRIEGNFFMNLRKKCFGPPPPPPRRRHFFWTGGAPPPPTQIDRPAAADTMTSAHSSTSAKGRPNYVMGFGGRSPNGVQRQSPWSEVRGTKSP